MKLTRWTALACASMLSVAVAAQIPISSLPAAGPMSGSEILPLVQGGTTRQITAATVARTVTKGAQFSATGGVGSSTSTYSGGELAGGAFSINGVTGVATLGGASAPVHGVMTDVTTYAAPAPGSVSQLISDRLGKQLFVTDFGAKCDGSTDDTGALNLAYAAAASLHVTLFFPNGVCMTQGNVIATPSYAAQFAIIGRGRNLTTLRKLGTSSAPVLQIGSPSATIFSANIEISGITFDGVATTTSAALQSYDLVRSHIHDAAFANAAIGYASYGGIANSLNDVVATGNTNGMVFTKFASSAGGGWPNLIRVAGSQIVSNTKWGLIFDYGRMLSLDGDDIEDNGTTGLGADQGGVLIGSNIGAEVTVTDPLSPGANVTKSWFEGNLGTADIAFGSGINTVRDTNFFSTAAQTTNDIQVNGGRYQIDAVNSSFSKTANLLENSGASAGNIIRLAKLPNVSFSSAKTAVFAGDSMIIRNGSAPGVSGSTAPLIEQGLDATSANPTITFPQAFKAGTTPKVYTLPAENSSATLDQAEVYNVTATGFTLRKKSYNGATIGTSNYSVAWVAVGENP